jgi:hypothetical protein
MTHDEALAKFLASVITLWQKTPADELAAIGPATLVLELGTARVTLAANDSESDEAA